MGINAAAVDLEKSTGRRFMTLLHAAFSGGGILGALSAGALLSAGMAYQFVYLGVLIPLGAVILAVTLTGFPPSVESRRRRRGDRTFPALPERTSTSRRRDRYSRAASEGEMEHWSGIYLRQSLALPVLVGASGVAVFHAAMAVGRLGAAEVVAPLR